MCQKTQKQKWTIVKIICYLLYRVIGKHIPSDMGPIGRFSNKFRRLLCRPLFRESARIFGVDEGVNFGNGACIVMRAHANIGKDCSITGKGIVTIGRHVIMGHECMIITQNHKYLEEGYDGYDVKDVLIDDYSWIGHRVTILPGVRLGKHSIIGAGSIVTKDVPDYAIAAGVPAKVIRFRNSTKKETA